MDIRSVVDKLCRKYKTRNPYELADALNIILQYGDMKGVRGFYLYDSRIKLIYLSNSLPEHTERFVLAHEIGHAVLHKQSCAPFLQSTFISVDKMEIEANKFASELVITDSELLELPNYNIAELAAFYGLPKEIIELRFK